jgi:hypothetical protein
MNYYVSSYLTNRKSSIHLHALYSPRTALRTFTPRRVQLVICEQSVPTLHAIRAAGHIYPRTETVKYPSAVLHFKYNFGIDAYTPFWNS